MFSISAFFLGGLVLVASSCASSQNIDREPIATAEVHSDITSETAIRKPVAIASESAPDSCDRAKEEALTFLDTIGSLGPESGADSGQGFEMGREIGSSCGSSRSGIVWSEILLIQSNKIDQGSYSFPNLIKGVISGFCEEYENTSLDGFSLTAEGALVCAKSWEPNSIDIEKCRTDLRTVADNLETYDDDYFDRLFRESLRSCGDRSTWLAYAPSSISNMLNASCILYQSEPVCKN